MHKSFTLHFIIYVTIFIDYILSFFIRKITINTLCISITICIILFIQLKVNNRYIFKSSLKISFSSNEIYLFTSSDTKNQSFPEDKAYEHISTATVKDTIEIRPFYDTSHCTTLLQPISHVDIIYIHNYCTNRHITLTKINPRPYLQRNTNIYRPN